MRLYLPLKGIGTTPGIYLVQDFGADPIATQDTYYGPTLVKKGQHIYKVIANMDGHNGKDWAAPIGTPIYASHAGRLEFKEDKDKDGRYVGYGMNARIFFDEDGASWDLLNSAHMSKFNGASRDVAAGELIGFSGNSGASTGPHVHGLGIRKIINGQVQDYGNGFLGYLRPDQFIFMDFYKIKGESTIVAFYLNKYYEIATKPEDYAYIKAKFGIPDQFLEIGRDVVDSKKGGQVIVGMTFVSA